MSVGVLTRRKVRARDRSPFSVDRLSLSILRHRPGFHIPVSEPRNGWCHRGSARTEDGLSPPDRCASIGRAREG